MAAPGPAAEARLEAAIKAAHVDTQKIYPPNLLYAPKMKNGMIVTPSYPQAPEPAGLADYGVNNSTGTPSPYTIDTTSYTASVTLNSVTPYYLATGVPEGFTSQLNVVLKNVTLFGSSTYNFWTQNVFFYDAYSDQMFIENNIWNFSAPSAPENYSTFYWAGGYTNGTAYPSIGYYAAGTPTFTDVATPFTVVFYINATTLSLGPTNFTEVNFAFTLSCPAFNLADQYDRALFNNTGGTGAIPQAQFHVDGTNITPTGFIPYDAEVMLGGPGGGSTATFQAINGTMTLQHANATGAYVNEPSAWSSGSETGETSVGVAEYYDSSDVVHLGGGPEFIQPFWNSSATATSGAAVLNGTITPSNSWAFVTSGASYNVSTSAWAPLPVSGLYTWNLTSGTYVVKLMESDYTPVVSSAMPLTTSGATTYNLTLTRNNSEGVYTPLYAWSNSQLSAISSGGGLGTTAKPYHLLSNERGALAPEFATFNDYGFQSYPGISLVGTSAYVTITNAAPFTVNYGGGYYGFTQYYFLPSSDNLPIWLFNTSHVSILGGTISGWFGAFQDGFPYANVVIWNSTSTLVSAVTFDVISNAIFTYGGTNNTFTGNTFENAVLNGNFMVPVGYFYIPDYGIYSTYLGTTGIIENEGNDSIWNNYFATTVTAFETNANVYDDLYYSVPFVFTNNWNLSGAVPVPATTVFTVNGVSITGSVSGNATVCGNWWWNYGPSFANYLPGSAIPYDNPYPSFPVPYFEGTGNIITGGDYCPSGPAMFLVPIYASGLPTDTLWSANVISMLPQTLPYGGENYTISPGVLYDPLPAGTYEAIFSPVANYSVTPSTYQFTVEPNGLIYNGVGYVSFVAAAYTPLPGTIVFAESGLPTGTSWSVNVNDGVLAGTPAALSTSVAFGSYSYTVGAVPGYKSSPSEGTAVVTVGSITTVVIVFSAVTGTLSGTVSPAGATVLVDGTAVAVTSGAFSTSASAGVHSVEATLSGYYPYFNNVTVTSSTTTTVTISLNPVAPPVGADGTLSLTVTPVTATLWVDGTQATLTSGAYTASETPGVHSIEVAASGYYPYFNNVTVTSSATTTVAIALNLVTPPVGADGTLSLTVTTASATVWVDGTQVTLTSGAYSASETPGVHSIEVTASGYYPYFNNVTVTSSATTTVVVTLNAVSSSSSSNNGISNDAWIIIAVLVALVVILLIATLIYMGRSRGGSGGKTTENNTGSS